MGSLAGSFVFSFGGEDSGGSTPSSTPSSITGGAADTSVAEMLARHLPAMFRGPGWSALLAAIAVGDTYVKENAQLVYDQLFLSSASGVFLSRRGADVGFPRPTEVGMQDEVFRELAISTTSEKLTANAILKTLEIFYGPDAIRANYQSENPEPYALVDGEDLVLSVDGSDPVTVTFKTADFTSISSAKAIEVAETINRQFRLNSIQGFAVPHLDVDSGDYYLRVYSGARGIKGSVQITGGKAQARFLLPERISIDSIGKTWTITKTGSTLRFTPDSDPGLGNLLVGDYIVISGSEFNANNKGSFEVTDVYLSNSTKYFEVTNTSGTAEVVVQAGSSSIYYFRPSKASIQVGARTATVTQLGTSALEIKIPSTTQVVGRVDGQAAYLHTERYDITAASRAADGIVTATTSVPHGLQAGQWVHVDGLQSVATSGNSSGGLNGMYKVLTTPTSLLFTYSTPEFKQVVGSVYGGGTVEVFQATADSDVIGPYVYDLVGGMAITEKKSTTTVAINKNASYHTLQVSDSTQFPDSPGYLVIGLGHSYQAGIVPYSGRASNTSLVIDYSFVFPESVPAGATVSLLASKEAYVPETQEQIDGSFYVTGSAMGRVSCSDTLAGIIAEGIDATVDIVYPGDRGLGGEGFGSSGGKLSDKVAVWSGDEVDVEVEQARER